MTDIAIRLAIVIAATLGLSLVGGALLAACELPRLLKQRADKRRRALADREDAQGAGDVPTFHRSAQ